MVNNYVQVLKSMQANLSTLENEYPALKKDPHYLELRENFSFLWTELNK